MTVSSTFSINARLAIPRSELRFSYVRSSGPGGQNVNKVNTKAVLRWSVAKNRSLPPDVRERFLQRHASRLSERGDLVLTSQRSRDQPKNRADCLAKLQRMVLSVAAPPRPRKKTRPPRSANEARLREKRAVTQRKQRRDRPRDED
jgi:ribosome-associated protein